jgi:hypothetical protein
MFARVARAALFFATMFVVSSLARSAHASTEGRGPAPFCDDRGATALAAPPDLEAPDEAVRRVRASACDLNGGNAITKWMASFGRSRTQVGAAPETPGPAFLTATLVTTRDVSGILPACRDVGRPCTGMRVRVERPPRSTAV